LSKSTILMLMVVIVVRKSVFGLLFKPTNC
jgi:hypothetical protein